MLDNMRRLHPRGPTSRGISVDIDGAMLGPNCVLVEANLGAHRPISHQAAGFIQGLLLPGHRDPDWLFEQCGRIARALDERQVALAQIYGLPIPIDELDDRRLVKLARVTAFARTGFNPDEPRIPKGNPRGGEWTGSGDDEGSSDTSSSPSSDLGSKISDDDGGSGSTASPTPSDLGAGDSHSGGNSGGDDSTGGDGIPAPAPDASGSLPQSPSGVPASPGSSAEPAIEYIIVEPQSSEPATAPSPATDATAPISGRPAPLDSADLDYQIAPPAAIPATTEPSSGAGPEATNEPTPQATNPETSAAGSQPLAWKIHGGWRA